MSVCVCDACRGDRKHENAESPVTKHTRRSTVSGSPAPGSNSLVPGHAAVPATNQVAHNL